MDSNTELELFHHRGRLGVAKRYLQSLRHFHAHARLRFGRRNRSQVTVHGCRSTDWVVAGVGAVVVGGGVPDVGTINTFVWLQIVLGGKRSTFCATLGASDNNGYRPLAS